MVGLREFANRFLGRGEATITVPSFDGALKPNQRLESGADRPAMRARRRISRPTARSLYLADGARLLRLERADRDGAAQLRPADLGAGVAARRQARGGARRHARSTSMPIAERALPTSVFGGGALHAINALAPAPDGTLIATDGSPRAASMTGRGT